MRPRWRKVFADLWGNKTRFVLVVLSLTIGLFTVGMITAGYISILEDMQNGYNAINPADLRFMVDPFDEELLERVRRVEGVAAADGEKRLAWQFQNGDGEWKNLVIRVLPEDGQTIDQVELREGAYPEDREIMLDNHLETNLSLGDNVLVQLPSGTQKELPITGLVQDQTIGVIGTSYFVAPSYGYVTYDSLPWLEESLSYDNLLVTVSPGLSPDEIEQVSQEVKRAIEQSGLAVNAVTNLTPTAHPNAGYVEAMAGLLALLGAFSVFLSGFLVFNSMTALFAQQVQYIGIMKGIGAKRKTIVRMYTIFILIFSLIAMGIAIPTAGRAWTALSHFFSGRINYVASDFHYIPVVVALQAVIGLILPQLAGILPILKASKISVQEAIAQTGIESESTGKNKDKQAKSLKGITRPVLIAIRNTFRRKGRLILTLITLSLGGAMFIATFNVRASLESYVDKVSKYVLADVSVNFDRTYPIGEIERLTTGIPGIDSVEPRAAAYCQLVNENGDAAESVEMMGAPPESTLIEPILVRGRWLIPGDENAIVLNEAFISRYPDLDVGDTITLYVNRREVDWTIVGFFQFVGNDSFIVYVPLDYLNAVTGNINRASNFQIVATPEVVENDQVEELVTQVDTYFRDLGFHVNSTSSSASLVGNSTLGLDTLTIFLLIMAGLIALVGSIGLTGTMSMNVMERTREIGVMRAIGATDAQVMRQVIIEGTLIGLMSWVIATIVAFPLSYFMSHIINVSIFGMTGEYSLTITGFLIWFGIVGLLSMTASIMPARSAARLTIREVLAYE
jgi:putative ABC transport system permease protein